MHALLLHLRLHLGVLRLNEELLLLLLVGMLLLGMQLLFHHQLLVVSVSGLLRLLKWLPAHQLQLLLLTQLLHTAGTAAQALCVMTQLLTEIYCWFAC
jgi:hypothetical protein